MKVALLGAAGSGKTDLARSLARNLNRDKKGKWKVIDGYVEALTARTGRQYGFEADYPHNVQIMCERWTLEAEALDKGYSTISCGSIYDTITYAALLNLTLPSNEQDMVAVYEYLMTCMKFFGAMEEVTANYNAMFYLPYNDGEEERTWDSVVDAKIPEIVEAKFRVAHTVVGTPRQKVKHALEVIRFLRDARDEEPSPSDVEQAV